MDFPNNNVTCIAPWYELRINQDGSYTYCHASRNVKYMSDLNPAQWFESGADVSDARACIQAGTALTGCSECYQNEQQGIVSFRHRRNFQAAIFSGEFFRQSLYQSPAYKRMQNSNNIKPAFIHVSLSNLCNLACRTCSPELSSRVVSVFKRASIIDFQTPINLDWTKDTPKWESFVSLVADNPDLVSLHFMGGEPMLHDKFYELLDLCIDRQQTDFHLTFVTNGTVYRDDLIDKLKHFKSVQVEISIENLHKTSDYIRIGSNVDQIKHNIKLFSNHKSEKFTVVLRTVPQALSIQHYDTIIDFAIENQLTIDSNIIHNPEFLKIVVLPADVKKKTIDHLISKYKELINRDLFSNAESLLLFRNNNEFLKSISDHLHLILTLLKEKEPENIDVLRAQFVEFNKKLDTVSGLDFNSIYEFRF